MTVASPGYCVASELFVVGKKFAFLATGGVRGTNAQKYGYGGNTIDWEARAFGGLAFPIPIKKAIAVSPTVEIDQERTNCASSDDYATNFRNCNHCAPVEPGLAYPLC